MLKNAAPSMQPEPATAPGISPAPTGDKAKQGDRKMVAPDNLNKQIDSDKPD